jgi:hypothetical protein
MRDGELEGSLLSIIGSTGGKDLLKEAAEFSLDAVLDKGKDIPVIDTIAKLYSVAVGVQGYVFAKKIRKFLVELASISQSERDNFSKKLEEDEKLRERTAEVLITLLDKLDDLQKAPLLARAFSGYIRNEYDFSTFQRMAVAVDRCLVTDLSILERLQKPKGLDGYIGDVLVSAGLASIDTIPTIKAPGVQTAYILSHLGELFLQVVVRGLSRND